MLYLERISLRAARWVFAGLSKNLALVAKKLQFHRIINHWEKTMPAEIKHIKIKILSPIVQNEIMVFP